MKESELQSKRPTILIVDDVPVNIQLLAGVLSDDYDIKVATSGKRCLEIISATYSIDLILLDIEMPEMSGYEVCKRLKSMQNTSSIPIIFVTAKDEDADEELGLSFGAADYITKPVKPAIVKARVKTQITVKKQRDQLVRMALHDQLTTLYNRHYLMETGSLRVAKSLRHKYPMSIAVMDLDHFKIINDTLGHEAGDRVLVAVGETLKESTRKEDVTARLGGEEFVILFDHCNLEDAVKKTEILRKKIESLNPVKKSISSSFGVAELNLSGESFGSMLKRADHALYEAKGRGRNQVAIAK